MYCQRPSGGTRIGAAADALLAQAGFLQLGDLLFDAADSPDDDSTLAVLASLAARARRVVADRARGRRKATARWLAERVAAGDELHLAAPTPLWAGWMGTRLFWGIGRPRWRGLLAILGSRVGTRPERWASAFQQMANSCGEAAARKQTVLTPTDSAWSPYVVHAARRLEVPLCRIDVLPRRATAAQWRKRIEKWAAGREAGPMEPTWVVSPPLGQVLPPPIAAGVPLRDRAAAALAEQVLFAHVRPGGNMRRLTDALHFLPHGPATIDAPVANDEGDGLSAGLGRRRPRLENPVTRPQASPAACSPCATDAARWLAEPYLTHCTRAPQGCWPDESEEAYRDRLIFGDVEPPTSFASLRRILTQQRLRASSQSIRGQHACVCFSAVPLDRLVNLRTYRRHRHRWDFEPYGLCIRRAALERLGAAPVIYGPADQYMRLPPERRAWFQSEGRPSSGNSWRVEQEWRVAGDLRLTDFDADDVLIFVRTTAEAECLQTITPFPVYPLATLVELAGRRNEEESL